MVSWKRRGGAFLIDYVLFSAVWGIIDNSIVAPIPEILMSVSEVVLFCLYFTLTEGLGEKRASPGKRWMDMAVVMRDGRTPGTQVIFGRAAILSLILVADWERFIGFFSEDLLLVAYIAPVSIVAGLGAFNAWLGFRGRERLMLQDGLTGSQVIDGPVSTISPESGPVTTAVPKEWPSPGLCLGLVTVFLVGMLLFTSAMGSRPMAPSFAHALGFELERHNATTADVRTRVEVTENLEIEDDSRKRYLTIAIWFPYRWWHIATRDKDELPNATPENMELPIAAFASRADDFDSVLLKTWTEIGIAGLGWSNSSETWIDLKAPDFLFNLAAMYDEGVGVPKDDVEAAKWYQRAAEQGHRVAQYNLGEIYATGEGVAEDYEQAAKWFRMAAKRGYADAQYALASMYADGQGVEENVAEALAWYRKAAVQGHADSQYRLGVAYLRGLGVEPSPWEAAHWWRMAAEQEHRGAQYNLAVMHRTGEGVAQDDEQAARLFRMAAELGHASAQYALGSMYANGQGVEEDDAEAAVWYREAAEQGQAKSQYRLGFAYLRGRGVEPDPSEAARWWRMAAEQGDADAQYAYGYLCSKGAGVSLSLDDAVAWYRKAAAQGYSWAEYALGSHYVLGVGVEQDPEEAARWFQLVAGDDDYAAAAESFARQAEGGEDDAQFFLGMMHRYGHGVPLDDARAMEWFQKAADNGYVVAEVPLNQIQEGR